MILDLYKHMHWADATMWQSVLGTTKVVNDSRLRHLLHHIHLVQHAFLRIWLHEPLQFPEESAFDGLSAVARWGFEYHQQVQSYLNSISKADMEKIVEIPWAKQFADKKPGATTQAQTMSHLAMHTAHHRGQVMARLRDLDGEPPLVDFIAWCWLEKPDAEWPKGINK